MSNGTALNVPRLDTLSKLLITSDDLGRAKEADFVRSIKSDKIKMLVTDNHVSCVMLDPDVYSALVDASSQMKPLDK
ncbi:hypothetical protein [Raoultibacter phocaeensis]|uniref:hypothetical protein n=1 Tax=Raoultibacter phocaeensis TaxID=2479841 RepID=UPI00111A7588|nr:hypothetical protein [Raoultibacter phocaeensis]